MNRCFFALMAVPSIVGACAKPVLVTDVDTDTEPNSHWEGLGDALIQKMTEGNIPGMSVAITKPGQVLWMGAFGYADVGAAREVTVDTPFMLASVSKTVTAVAVMKAQEVGALSLDDDINTLLPFTVDNPFVEEETIQLRHLVSHTSGIQDNWSNMPYSEGDSSHALGVYLEGYLVSGGDWYDAFHNYYDYGPGQQWNYGNIATALAGYVVEVGTDTDFDTYCEESIFKVLDMDHTGWHLADFEPSTLAVPYAYEDGGFSPYTHYGYPDYPDGQLRSSVSDMALFLAAMSKDGALGDQRVLSSESVSQMFQAPEPAVSDTQYVFWYADQFGGREVIGHNGGDRGVATQMVFAPDTGIGVIVLMNTSWTDPLVGAAEDIQELLFDRAEAL